MTRYTNANKMQQLCKKIDVYTKKQDHAKKEIDFHIILPDLYQLLLYIDEVKYDIEDILAVTLPDYGA